MTVAMVPEDRKNREPAVSPRVDRQAEDRLHRKIQGKVKYRILLELLSGKKNIKQAALELKVSRITVWKWMRKMEDAAIKALTIEKAGRKAGNFSGGDGAAAEIKRQNRAIKNLMMQKLKLEAKLIRAEKDIDTAERALAYFLKGGTGSKKN